MVVCFFFVLVTRVQVGRNVSEVRPNSMVMQFASFFLWATWFKVCKHVSVRRWIFIPKRPVESQGTLHHVIMTWKEPAWRPGVENLLKSAAIHLAVQISFFQLLERSANMTCQCCENTLFCGARKSSKGDTINWWMMSMMNDDYHDDEWS